MKMDRDQWGSDAPISAPVPDDSLNTTPMMDLGGFIFGASALRLPVNSVLYEERYTPLWAPQVDLEDGLGRGRTD